MTRLVGGLLVLAVLATGCTSGDPDPASSGSASPSGSPSAKTAATKALDREYAAVERLLERRSDAIVAGDRPGFVSTTAPGTGRQRQLSWFGPMAQLPLAKVSYDVRLIEPQSTDRHTTVQADMLVQIAGFDPMPVPVSHTLVVRKLSGGYRVLRDRALRDESASAPWIIPGVRFTVTPHVLVVTDRGSSGEAADLARLAEAAIVADDRVIPYDWSDKVVIFSVSDARSIRGDFGPLAIKEFAGSAVPVRGPDESIIESRVILSPTTLDYDERNRTELLRHEIAHVAMGTHDDRDPNWVVEGIADYVSQQGNTVKYLDSRAVEAAQRGIDAMPADFYFYDRDPEQLAVNYGVAWYSMEWLAARHGPDAPFDLVDLLHAKEPIDFHEESDLLQEKYQVTTDELAHQAGLLIHQTYGAPG